MRAGCVTLWIDYIRIMGQVCRQFTLLSSRTELIDSFAPSRTAKVWRDFQEVYELKGHTHSVWAVRVVDETQEIFLTGTPISLSLCFLSPLAYAHLLSYAYRTCTPIGSADMTIKMWQKNKVLHTYSGPTSAVRGLALLPGIGFASCSNDRLAFSFPYFSLSGHRSHQ